jgi:hypothetical protein
LRLLVFLVAIELSLTHTQLGPRRAVPDDTGSDVRSKQ